MLKYVMTFIIGLLLLIIVLGEMLKVAGGVG